MGPRENATSLTAPDSGFAVENVDDLLKPPALSAEMPLPGDPKATAGGPRERDSTSVALDLVKELRKDTPGLPYGSIVNFDLAVAFVERYRRMVRDLGPERALPRVVYHGTAKANFNAIIAGNLRVPDGDQVVSVSGRSTYGHGIYVSTNFDLAVQYGKKHWGPQPALGAGPSRAEHTNQPVFVCLSLPGRQHISVPPEDTGSRRVREGFDSHVSADRGGQISVYFDSAQLLPCFLSAPDTLVCAKEASGRAVSVLTRAYGRPGAGSSVRGGDAGSNETAQGMHTGQQRPCSAMDVPAPAGDAVGAEPDNGSHSEKQFEDGAPAEAPPAVEGAGESAPAPEPEPLARVRPRESEEDECNTAEWDGVKRVRIHKA